MEVDFVALLVGAVASFVVGFIWYSPGVFGSMWMQMSGISKSDMEEAKKKGMMGNMFAGFLAQLVMGYVLWMFMSSTGMTEPAGGVETAAWLWLGFVATILLGTVLWERKPFKLYALNAAHWLVAMCVMGAVLGAMS